MPEKLTYKYKGTEDKTLNLNDPKSTFLLIARGNLKNGDLVSQDSYSYHEEKSPSSAAVNFASPAAVGAVTETWLGTIHRGVITTKATKTAALVDF